MSKLPYKLTSDGRTIASYKTLQAAVAGARRLNPAATGDAETRITCDGETVRSLYHHGRPEDRRWDA